MKLGKVPTEVLQQSIFANISAHRPEVLVRPGVGEDCAVVDFGEYYCVMSTDPITGAAADIGSLAVHISCNDIASNGVEPLGIMLTILAPLETTEGDLAQVMKEANQAALSVGVEIIGGHTEITDAVNRMVISATAIGRQNRAHKITSQGAQLGDLVVMTKHCALEGTAILAKDLYPQLQGQVSEAFLQEAQGYLKDLSVVPEGVIAGKLGVVHSMHDVTEGGILGCLWELAEASNLGVEVDKEAIPVREATKAICSYLGVDPYRLVSSGVMVMTVAPSDLQILLDALQEKGIQATVIGKMTGEERVIVEKQQRIPLEPPRVDELYRANSSISTK